MAIGIKTLTACGLVFVFGSCSPSNDASTGPNSVGGSGSTGGGGASSNGGSNSPGLGGAATGGLANIGGTIFNGGAMSTGGVPTTGGAASTGGAFNTGGINSAGGLVATGGASSTSAVTSTGGKSATGGGFSTGGESNAGGTSSTGGKSATGGLSTGGKSNAAGTSSTGGTRSTGGMSSTGGAKSTGGMTSTPATGGSTSTCTPSPTLFSFFITSRTRLFALAQAFNGSSKGFGGDFRYGTGNGLTGADKICTAIAEASMPGNCKVWRAFLSTSTVTAISRVGSGPWYDRLGRIVTTNTAGLLGDRPTGANTTIINNLPNEDGVLHHLEETNSSAADNHDILTGSTTQGTLYGATANCSDWTSSAASTTAKPRVGHSWSAMSGTNWISCLDESGCGPGYNLVETGGPGNDGTVGSGGGYGAFYCLATTP